MAINIRDKIINGRVIDMVGEGVMASKIVGNVTAGGSVMG